MFVRQADRLLKPAMADPLSGGHLPKQSAQTRTIAIHRIAACFSMRRARPIRVTKTCSSEVFQVVLYDFCDNR